MDTDMDMDMDKDMMTDASLSSDAFCTSGMHMHNSLLLARQEGMIMYMDGFRFSLSGNSPCLNLYFPSWTLDTRGKFWWAMVGVVLLGIVTEGISKLRSLLSKNLTGSAKRWTITLLHGLQALVGYILMLATMTFSVELLACVIVGLGLGFALFYDDDDLHVTTNPCCNFIQEEFNERASRMRRQNLEEEQRAKEDSPLLTTEQQTSEEDESQENQTRV